MRLPIKNNFDRPLTVFMEPMCNQFEIPPGGEAIVRIEDGFLGPIEFEDAWVTIYDTSCCASVEIVSDQDRKFDGALRLASTWLFNLGAITEGKLIDDVVEELEPISGYLDARKQVFISFYDGFKSLKRRNSSNGSPPDANLAACRQAGVVAARLNEAARLSFSFPGFGIGPLDTDLVKSAFASASVFARTLD